MKNLPTLLFTIAAVASIHAADIRYVGLAKVDLTPIQKWEEDKSGERPMKHWKDIKITSYYAAVPWPMCAISIDGGKDKGVYLKNVPSEFVIKANEEHRLLSLMADKETWIASEKKRLRDWNVHSSEWEYGSPNYIRYHQDVTNLENKEDEWEELRQQWKRASSDLDSSRSDLAMFTGQFYKDTEVWDMGRKQ